MKFKHLIFLGMILFLLLAALYVKKILITSEIETTEYKSLEISLNASDVYAIEFKKAQEDDTLKLVKKDEEWFIPTQWNIRAKKQSIERLLEDISGLQGELRSSSKEVLPDYGLTDEEAFSIGVFDENDKPIQQFFVGTKKPSYGKSFLRKADSVDVYLVDKDIFSLLGIYGEPKEAKINTERWIDLSIIEFEVEKIEAIKIVRLEQEHKIISVDIKKELDEKKNLKKWVAVGEVPVFDLDAKKIKEFLKKINKMYATKAVEPKAKEYGFDNPYLTVSLTSQESQIELLLGAQEKGENRYVKTSPGFVYILPKYRVKDLDIDISRFFIDNPLRIDKDKLQVLTIKAGESVITLNKDLLEKNGTYIDKLKKFSVEKMLFAEKYSAGLQTPVQYLLKIERKEANPLVLNVQKEDDNTYIAQVEAKADVFLISKNVFENIFTGLDNLNLTLEESKSESE
jgi:hypothetical protein